MSKVSVSLFVILGGVILVKFLNRGGVQCVFNLMVGLVMWAAEVLVFDVCESSMLCESSMVCRFWASVQLITCCCLIPN